MIKGGWSPNEKEAVMKMGRRGFLGLLGGAAASGPTLATGLAAGAGGAPSVGRLSAGMFSGPGSIAGVDRSYKLSRIAQLRKLLTGEDPEEQRSREQFFLNSQSEMERFRLDGLRSVSPVNRMRMFQDGEYERRKRAQRLYHEFELADLLRDPE